MLKVPALTALDLRSVGATAEDLALLAHSRPAERLRRLDLSNNKLNGEALQGFVSSRLVNLKDLHLSWNWLGEEGGRALAEAPFHGLVRLGLRACRLGRYGLAALLGTHGFLELSLLDLWQGGFDEEVEGRLSRGLVQAANARDALRDHVVEARRAAQKLLLTAESEAPAAAGPALAPVVAAPMRPALAAVQRALPHIVPD